MAARPVVRELDVSDGSRHRGLRRREPRLPDRLLERRQGLPQLRAEQQGLPRPGFVPPLLYATAKSNPGAFIDITPGSNALFGGSCCPARPGFDLATGIGSPLANQVAALLGARG